MAKKEKEIEVKVKLNRDDAEAYLNVLSTFVVQYQHPGTVALRKFTDAVEKKLGRT